MNRVFAVVWALALVPAAALAARADEPWFRAEKVRCIAYLYPDEHSAEFPARIRELGFNTALVNWGGGAPERLGPVVAAADQAGLHLVMVTYFHTDRYLEQFPQTRRFIGPDGTVNPHAPCPAEEHFWQTTMGEQAAQVARLRAQGGASVAGVLFDMEDYPNLRDNAATAETYCFCDSCFEAFLQAIAATEAPPPPLQRQQWVVSRGLWDRYRQVQDDRVHAILRDLREQVDRLAPTLMFAVYPWGYVEPARRDARIDWGIRMARALGTPEAPFLILDEGTYDFGFEPRIQRQQAEYASLGLHFLAVSGFNIIPAARVWYPQQMADSAYWACRLSDGYWLYEGAWPLLYVPAGRPTNYVFGGQAWQWVNAFTRMNKAVAAGRRLQTAPLPLPEISDHWTLSELYDLRYTPEVRCWVRPWSDIDLPWEGGELVLLATQPGDWMSFQCRMGRPDVEEISAWLTTGPDRGIVQAYVNDEPLGEPVDLYAPVTTPGDEVALGLKFLTRGMHTYKFVVVGKHPQSSGYAVGLRALWTEDIGWPPAAWMVIGPFGNGGQGRPGFEEVYPPEREIDLDAVYEGKRAERVAWREARAEANGYLDLLKVYSARDAVAYCLTHVYSPTAGPRLLLFGSGDGGKVWVNGEYVWGEPVGRAPAPEQNHFRVHLRQGWNTVLVKVLREHGAWGIYFRAYDPDNQIEYAPAPPPR